MIFTVFVFGSVERSSMNFAGPLGFTKFGSITFFPSIPNGITFFICEFEKDLPLPLGAKIVIQVSSGDFSSLSGIVYVISFLTQKALKKLKNEKNRKC